MRMVTPMIHAAPTVILVGHHGLSAPAGTLHKVVLLNRRDISRCIALNYDPVCLKSPRSNTQYSRAAYGASPHCASISLYLEEKWLQSM